MIVVSDTSPLNYLVLIEAIDILPELFGQVHVPPAVMQELQHPRTPEAVKDWAQSPPQWLSIRAASVATSPDGRLDPGEAEAIALALELRAGAILIDEKRGRRAAKDHGLTLPLFRL
jgi:predicted nucleic acid-binding protein